METFNLEMKRCQGQRTKTESLASQVVAVMGLRSPRRNGLRREDMKGTSLSEYKGRWAMSSGHYSPGTVEALWPNLH